MPAVTWEYFDRVPFVPSGLAVTLITGYIMYFLLSPFSSMIMLMSGLSGQSVYAVGLRMNIRYALIVALVVMFAVYLWRHL
ncbi:hypothetical protein [Anaerosporomusa subterranea]|uniref:hypothetical protein n=1 Tax=Anaerosporomusa subterranea TaxID=1794912 RepID=UPI0012E70B06|nr:hypothetical protein [Anaerosporomusa subterranea]